MRMVQQEQCGNSVGVKTLSKYVKTILDTVGIDSKNFSNMSTRSTVVTRMVAKGVPDDVGMLITGYKATSSYRKYNRLEDVNMQAAQHAIMSHGGSYNESLKILSSDFVKDKLVGATCSTALDTCLNSVFVVLDHDEPGCEKSTCVPLSANVTSGPSALSSCHVGLTINDEAGPSIVPPLERNFPGPAQALSLSEHTRIPPASVVDESHSSDHSTKLGDDGFWDLVDWDAIAKSRPDPKVQNVVGLPSAIDPPAVAPTSHQASVFGNSMTHCNVTINVVPIYPR